MEGSDGVRWFIFVMGSDVWFIFVMCMSLLFITYINIHTYTH